MSKSPRRQGRALKELLPVQHAWGQVSSAQAQHAQHLVQFLAERLPPTHQAAFLAQPANQFIFSLP